ncbi:sterol desaturase family protein [Limibacter armeniacum]
MNTRITPKNKGTKQLFQNGLLEKLTRTHAAVPITLFIIIGIGLLSYGIYQQLITVVPALMLFLAGLLSFTLIEYLVHRFVFHMEPDTSLKKDIAYKFHGVHHEYPKDKSRLAMPPVLSILLSSILFLAFLYIMGNIAYGFFPGFIVGYAAYLIVHYIVHAYRPPKNFFRILWVHHGIHHYKRNDKAFGVSSPLWDYIFRSMP